MVLQGSQVQFHSAKQIANSWILHMLRRKKKAVDTLHQRFQDTPGFQVNPNMKCDEICDIDLMRLWPTIRVTGCAGQVSTDGSCTHVQTPWLLLAQISATLIYHISHSISVHISILKNHQYTSQFVCHQLKTGDSSLKGYLVTLEGYPLVI